MAHSLKNENGHGDDDLPTANEGSLQHSVKFKTIKNTTTKYNTPDKNSYKSKNTTVAPLTHQPQAWDFAMFNKDFNNVQFISLALEYPGSRSTLWTLL